MTRILVTNDDGIGAPGLAALVEALTRVGRVAVVAPDRQQSAVGHALTVSEPLRAFAMPWEGTELCYAVNGTPADCVKLAVSVLLPWRPDVVLSGINHGRNTAVNILYSGTVSAATEAALLGIPAMAISLDTYAMEADFRAAAAIAVRLVELLPQLQLPERTLLNVNVPAIPAEHIRGVRVTHQGRSLWRDWYERRQDPWGREYFWLAGEYELCDSDPDADDVALVQGYISITPIRFELTDTATAQRLKGILEPMQRDVPATSVEGDGAAPEHQSARL
jgi:5'-nucleotidase